MADTNWLVAILGALGIGGAVGAYFTALFQRQSHTRMAEFEERLKRYRSTLVYMQVFLHPEDIQHLPVDVLQTFDIKTREDVKSTLQAEYSHMALFAPDYILHAVKRFIENPSEESYWKSLLEIRRALWAKKTSLEWKDLATQRDVKR